MELKIEYLSKEELKPYAGNAKIHTEAQVEQIKNSIRDFGFNDPIAVWHDNEIIEGHGRLLAAMEMDEIEKVPVIRLDDLTDAERKAYIIAHNKLTLNTGFDNATLSEEIRSIMDDINMTDYGFGDFELAILTEDFEPEPFNDHEFDSYEAAAENMTNRRVIITYQPQQEEDVKMLLGIVGPIRTVYSYDELTGDMS